MAVAGKRKDKLNNQIGVIDKALSKDYKVKVVTSPAEGEIFTVAKGHCSAVGKKQELAGPAGKKRKVDVESATDAANPAAAVFGDMGSFS